MTDVRSSMGQSKIEVFRRILGGEQAAQQANEAFEDHYAAAVRAGHVAAMPGATTSSRPAATPASASAWPRLPHDPGRDHLRARLGRADRPGPVPRRRRPRPPVSGPAADRAAVRRRGRQRAGGGRRYRQRRRVRLRAGAGIVAAYSRATPRRPGAGGAPLIVGSIAAFPSLSDRAEPSYCYWATSYRLGRQRDRDRGARGQWCGLEHSALSILTATSTGQQELRHRGALDPRYVLVATIPLPFLITAMASPSGRHQHVHGARIQVACAVALMDRLVAAERGHSHPVGLEPRGQRVHDSDEPGHETRQPRGPFVQARQARAICSSSPCCMTSIWSAIHSVFLLVVCDEAWWWC